MRNSELLRLLISLPWAVQRKKGLPEEDGRLRERRLRKKRTSKGAKGKP